MPSGPVASSTGRVPGTKQPVTIVGTGFSQATGVTFSHTGITAVMKTGVTDTSLPLTLQVASTVPLGTYTFTVTTSLGTANSGSVTLTVGAASGGFVHAKSHVSVWIPKGTSSGPSYTAAPSSSEFRDAAIHGFLLFGKAINENRSSHSLL
jgi:hypothetical protein